MKKFRGFMSGLGLYMCGFGAVGIPMAGALTYLKVANDINDKKTAGLNLMPGDFHMKKGNHRVVITNQFWEAYIPDASEVDKKITVNGMKKAYKDLNDACSGISFELCTTEDEPTKFGIPKIDKVKKNDIPLYVEDLIDNNKYVLGNAHCENINPFTFEIGKLDITYKKEILDAVYSEKYLNVPHNAVIYDIAVHETMHCMGFAHNEDKDSVMYKQISGYKFDYSFLKDPNYTCLSADDKIALDKYCVEFYGAEPKYKENGGNLTVSSNKSVIKSCEEMSF